MAIRIIRKNNDEILRKKSKIVKSITASVHTILDDMYETMVESNGIGLAAPQIGILKQIVIIRYEDDFYELINPVIVDATGEQEFLEGCLSVPNVFGYVKRPSYLKITALNRQGEEVIYEFKDFLATIVSHELDHLQGVVFIDHESFEEAADDEISSV